MPTDDPPAAEPVLDPALVRQVGSLPSPSGMVRRLQQVLTAEETTAGDVEQVLRKDPAMCGKILRLANSAYIGIPHSVSSLHNAIVLLGFKRIYSLVIASGSFSHLGRQELPRGLHIRNFWAHSTVVAGIAESIARHLRRYEPVDPDEVFTAALLHDIGKLLVGVYGTDHFSHALRKAREENTPFFHAEQKEWAHHSAGAFLCRQWHYPEALTAAVRDHHRAGQSGTVGLTTAIVHLADAMAHIMGFGMVPGEMAPSIEPICAEMIALSPERLRIIARDVTDCNKQIESFIDCMA